MLYGKIKSTKILFFQNCASVADIVEFYGVFTRRKSAAKREQRFSECNTNIKRRTAFCTLPIIKSTKILFSQNCTSVADVVEFYGVFTRRKSAAKREQRFSECNTNIKRRTAFCTLPIIKSTKILFSQNCTSVADVVEFYGVFTRRKSAAKREQRFSECNANCKTRTVFCTLPIIN